MIARMVLAPNAAELIRLRRQELGLKQREFAALVGVDPSTVIAWEKRRHSPERYQGKIEAVLRISLSGQEEPDPQEQEIRDLGTRLGLTPADQDEWIKLYRSRKAAAPQRRTG